MCQAYVNKPSLSMHSFYMLLLLLFSLSKSIIITFRPLKNHFITIRHLKLLLLNKSFQHFLKIVNPTLPPDSTMQYITIVDVGKFLKLMQHFFIFFYFDDHLAEYVVNGRATF